MCFCNGVPTANKLVWDCVVRRGMKTSKTTLEKGRILSRLLREVVLYGLVLLVAGFLGNLWMTRGQVSGAPPGLSGQIVQPDRVAGGTTAGRLDLAAYDKPMLLYFFAEWCPICKLQNPVIENIAEDYPVIGVAMQSGDAGKIRRYLEQRGLNIPVVNDPSGRISRSYGVNGVPAAFVIGPDGEIRYSTRGYATEAGLRSRLWLAGEAGPG
ncbi:MAG TPA: protein disulfide oxidoreductase [Gammaproteobacteria bacterium]|nr:protein disulfide oxidoreductase [Gammaproteobacteria bacterium]